MVHSFMLVCYNGEVKEVEKRDGGCSACTQSAGSKRSLEYVREADYYLADGRLVHFVKGKPQRISDTDGLVLLDLTYEFDGVTHDKFTVVGT